VYPTNWYVVNQLVWSCAALPKKSQESLPTEEEARLVAAWIDAAARAIGSRADAAKVAGITVTQLGRLIAGTRITPSFVTLAKLSLASGFSLDAVLDTRASAALEATAPLGRALKAAAPIGTALPARDVARMMGNSAAHAYAPVSRVLGLVRQLWIVLRAITETRDMTASGDALHEIASSLVAMLLAVPDEETDQELIELAVTTANELLDLAAAATPRKSSRPRTAKRA
jgi:hypothetical protein